MRIVMASLAGARRCIEEWKPDAILSVVSPSMAHAIPTTEGSRHLRLLCHDLEVFEHRGMRGPTSKQIGTAIRFAQEGHERLLVHCGFGLARAPAFAIVAALATGWDVADACRAIRAAEPKVQPNRRVLHLADALLALDGRLIAEVPGFTYRRTTTGARGSPIGWRELKPAGKAQDGDAIESATRQAGQPSSPPAASAASPLDRSARVLPRGAASWGNARPRAFSRCDGLKPVNGEQVNGQLGER